MALIQWIASLEGAAFSESPYATTGYTVRYELYLFTTGAARGGWALALRYGTYRSTDIKERVGRVSSCFR